MNFEIAREQMLDQQIRTWDVLDPAVLRVLRATPRELFVPEAERDLAFADTEIPIGHGQCMMAPKVEARLLQELRIESIDRALEIGTGSGYLAACLAQLAAEVETIEIHPDLSSAAAERLRALERANVNPIAGDAMQLSGSGEYDVIAVTASVPVLHEPFVRMLRPRGRMFIVVGRAPVMEARLISMHQGGQWTEQSLFETMLTPMINAERTEPFIL